MPMDSFLSKEKCTGIFKCLARNNSTSKQDELNEVHFLAVILTSTPQSLYILLLLLDDVYAFSKLLLLRLFTYLYTRKHR